MTSSSSSLSGKKLSPLAWVSTVYFAMGLPMVMISDVSLLVFKDLGVSDAQITFWASLLILPWSLKPLFSPVMEIFGTKKQYVVLSEIFSTLMLGLIAVGLGGDNFLPVVVGLMALLAFSGSIHDIAGDGTYMHALTTKEQSMYIGWQGAFYNIAKLLAKGGLVFLVGFLTKSIGLLRSWQVVFVIAAVLIGGIAVYHFFVLPGRMRPGKEKGPDAEGNRHDLSTALRDFMEVFVSFFTKKYIWLYLLFIFLYRFTEGLAIKVAPLFMKADTSVGGLALSNEHFGLIYGTLGTLAFVFGSILSGYFISSKGLKKVLFPLILIFNLPFVVFFLLAQFHPDSLFWIGLGITLEQFGYGFGFVGLSLFMMQQVAKGPHQMAHYSIATSLMNLSFMLPGLVSGALSDVLGYRTFFLIAVLMAIPGILCALKVPFSYDDEGNPIGEL